MTADNTQLIKTALDALVDRRDLEEQQAFDVLCAMTDESVAPALTAALLTALRCKGETAEEIRGFARSMRSLAICPKLKNAEGAVDIVGTGGDGSGSLNISTGSALLAAASGLTVTKHGNRSVSSKSGSADVLEHLGMQLPETADGVDSLLQRSGFCFLFAPYFHPAMKAIAPVRQAMGMRTVFNILGPLTNPVEPPYSVIGAFSEPMAKLMAEALSGMNIERAFVVHGEPGWDEATPVGPFVLFDVRPGVVEREVRDPMDYRIRRCKVSDLAGGDASVNAKRMAAALNGNEPGPHLDALVLGAALALEVTGTTKSMRASMSQAREAINAGRGREVLKAIRHQGSIDE